MEIKSDRNRVSRFVQVCIKNWVNGEVSFTNGISRDKTIETVTITNAKRSVQSRQHLPLFEHDRLQHGRLAVRNVRPHGRDHLQEVLDRVHVLLGAEPLVQLARVLLLARLLGGPRADQIPERLDRLRDERQRAGRLLVLFWKGGKEF